MDFENINQRLGGCGRYHYVAFFLLAITTFKFSGDFQALTFALHIPKFNCSIGNKNSTKYQNLSYYTSIDQCRYRTSLNSSWMPCLRWTYERDVLFTSHIMEFNMVCNRDYLRELMFLSYFLGGLCTYGPLMFIDMIGRRYVLIMSLYLSVVLTIWQVLTRSLWQHFMLIFLTGFLKTIYITLSFTTLIELMPINRLDIAASNFWNFYGINYVLCSLFAFYGRSWRAISWMSLMFSIFYILYLWFIPETPRWLMLNQKRNESFKALSFIAKFNHRTLLRTDIDDWKPVQQKTGRFWNLFKYKVMVYRLLILNFAAWAFAFAYIGSATDLEFASSNIFITTFVMGAIELLVGPTAGFAANRLGRKKSIYALSSLGILGLLTMSFLEVYQSRSSWQPWLKLICAVTGKFGFTSSWTIFDIISNELLPTSDRNSGMSLVNIAVSLGSLVAPMIHTRMLRWYPAAPFLAYSILLIITIFLIIVFIPETHNLPVPQTIEQAVSLLIHKEQEWKSNMILQAEKLITDNRTIEMNPSIPKTEN